MNHTINHKTRGAAETGDALVFQHGTTPTGTHNGINIIAGNNNNNAIPTQGYVDERNIRLLSWFVPLSGVTDNQFFLFGTYEAEANNQTGDYNTRFSANHQYVFLEINSIAAGGQVVITGTSVDDRMVPLVLDSETITVDKFTGKYKTIKKWLEITSINVAGTTGINYNIGYLSYFSISNSFTLLSYRLDIRTAAVTSDLRIIISRVKNETNQKFALLTLEDYGFTSAIETGTFYDHLRTGVDRSYTMAGHLAPNNFQFGWQVIFSDYFQNNENTVLPGEGFIIKFQGYPNGLTAIDHVTLSAQILVHS